MLFVRLATFCKMHVFVQYNPYNVYTYVLSEWHCEEIVSIWSRR